MESWWIPTFCYIFKSACRFRFSKFIIKYTHNLYKKIIIGSLYLSHLYLMMLRSYKCMYIYKKYGISALTLTLSEIIVQSETSSAYSLF